MHARLMEKKICFHAELDVFIAVEAFSFSAAADNTTVKVTS